ncbi:hypothetical protein PILCRDRAFT_821648 [Piloderma croceum F 1598]|uniref:Uncharacterized protein n=1 Tax=Piloderma croceum (strain F 1598) TaxID=765440 RepID=A0A0C3F989_PILCF|nr:hypothetical protein PILCRDRAFT_821648 [Piloderma croceum F 1598]
MTTNHLPLRWTRLVILSLLTVMAITASALCVEMFEKHTKAKNAANKNAPSGIKVSIDYNDIQTTTILMFLILNVITFLASHIVMALVQDMYHIVPESIARRLKITDKTLSTSTLAYQAIGLASTTALLVIPLGFLTAFVFTKEARVVVSDNGVGLECPIAGPLNDLCLRTVYDETPYIRINAEIPWTVVLLGIMGAIVTFAAWYKRPEYIPDAAAKPSAEIIGSETRIVDAPLYDVESARHAAS